MSRAKADPVIREYARIAPQYDSRWSFYVRSSVETTIARLPLRVGQRLRDVGCGTGQLLGVLKDRIPSAHLLGVDASFAMLAVGRSRLTEALLVAAARAGELPFRDATFDWVVSTSVFHYLRDPRGALREFHRVLKPGGSLIMTDWCDDFLACKVCSAALRVFSRSHFRTYTLSQCDRLLHEASFQAVVIDRYRISWIWGLMTARAEKHAV